VAAALVLAGCGGSTHPAASVPPTPAAPPSPTAPTARSYPDVESLVAAMAVGAVICRNVQFVTDSTVAGAVDPLVQCDGASQGDTSIVVFRDHTSAEAFAGKMLALGKALGERKAEVIGPDWVVNTSPAFARRVVAVGGQLAEGKK
jgi:hypothetical protein